MDRLLTFWQKYRPQADRQALLYLREMAHVQTMEKDSILKYPHQSLSYFCIVLEGVVGGFEASPRMADGTAARPEGHEQTGDPQLRELILPMDYFSGPGHLFTQRNRAIEYRTLVHTSLLLIPLSHAREGQQQYPDLSELFQVMKQRKINLLRQQVALYQEKDHYRRYCLYRQLLPQWAYVLPHGVQQQFLQMGRASYFAVKQHYLVK